MRYLRPASLWSLLPKRDDFDKSLQDTEEDEKHRGTLNRHEMTL